MTEEEKNKRLVEIANQNAMEAVTILRKELALREEEVAQNQKRSEYRDKIWADHVRLTNCLNVCQTIVILVVFALVVEALK